MSRQLALMVSIATLVSTSATAVGHAQSTIAHWSFDAGTITTDTNGIVTAADATGTHNATRTSAATGVRPIQSVAGRFGEAAQFTNVIGEDAGGASRLQIPNLFEFMGATAGDFTVATWANTLAVGQDNTILSDWIATNTYWFLLDNTDGGTTTRPRGQLRDTDGTDIIAHTLSSEQAGATSFADGEWHHYTWAYRKVAGEMDFFIDGLLRHTQGTGNADHNVRVSSNTNAHIGWKQDSNDHFSGMLDEVWVFDGALSEPQVSTLLSHNLPPEPVANTMLTLRVDPNTGLVAIKNATSGPISITGYSITSDTESLNVAGWDPLGNGNEFPDEFPPGDGEGNGWETAPNPSSSELVEWYLTGDSMLGAGQLLDLGYAFNPAAMKLLEFQYTLSDETLKTGLVDFSPIPVTPPLGDYNDNGVVDAADYAVWRRYLDTNEPLPNDAIGGQIGPAQYEQWRSNFGQRRVIFDVILGAGSAVPEPTTACMLLLSLLIGGAWRRGALSR